MLESELAYGPISVAPAGNLMPRHSRGTELSLVFHLGPGRRCQLCHGVHTVAAKDFPSFSFPDLEDEFHSFFWNMLTWRDDSPTHSLRNIRTN